MTYTIGLSLRSLHHFFVWCRQSCKTRPWLTCRRLSDFIVYSPHLTDPICTQFITIWSSCLTGCQSFSNSRKRLCTLYRVELSSLERKTMCVSTLLGQITSELTLTPHGSWTSNFGLAWILLALPWHCWACPIKTQIISSGQPHDERWPLGCDGWVNSDTWRLHRFAIVPCVIAHTSLRVHLCAVSTELILQRSSFGHLDRGHQELFSSMYALPLNSWKGKLLPSFGPAAIRTLANDLLQFN